MSGSIHFVSSMISDEHVSGEFMISSGVQHAVVQLLIDFPMEQLDREKMNLCVDTVMSALQESGVSWNEFLIGESLRGMILGLVSLGLMPDEATRLSMNGLQELMFKKHEMLENYAKSCLKAICVTGEDLGLKPWQLRRMVSYLNFDEMFSSEFRTILQDTSEAELKDYLTDEMIRMRSDRIM